MKTAMVLSASQLWVSPWASARVAVNSEGSYVLGWLRPSESQLRNPPIPLSAGTLLLGSTSEMPRRARRAAPAIWGCPRSALLAG